MTSTFAERLKKAMEIKDLSSAELARKSNTPAAVISQYRSGKYKPKQSRLYIFAEILDVSIPWLMGLDVPIKEINNNDLSNIKNIMPLPKTKLIPMLGTIACGEPILAEENIETYFPADNNVKADFCLKCKGDSMINAHIFDGDVVYLRSQPDVEDGQIAAVLIGEEATLKKVRKINNKLVLSPCNPLYDDMVFMGEELNNIKILGKAIAYTGMIK